MPHHDAPSRLSHQVSLHWRLVRGSKGSQAEPACCDSSETRRLQPESPDQGRSRPSVKPTDPFVSRGKETDDRHAVGGGRAAQPSSRSAVGPGSLMMRSSQSEPKNVLFGMRTGPFSLRPQDYLTVTPLHPPFPQRFFQPSPSM